MPCNAQELYARLATSRQGANPYWPPKLDWGETQSDDVLQARKQVEPTAGWVIPGGVEIPWLWWGIPCQLNHAGYPMRAMKDASEWGRAAWVGWSLHDVSTLAELSPREVADLITEVVAAEGPVVIGRAFDLLRQGSGAPRMSKSIRNALESGVGSGVRSGDLVVASGRRGEPDSRVLRLATQPEVMLRTPGDRDIWSIPGPELAELADRIREGEPAIERDALKRRVAQVLGWARYTAPLDKLLETAIPKVG